MKLSIITINYNNASGLQQTLESVAKQTWCDFEHIVVDGASTDESVDVIKGYESVINNQQSTIQLQWVSEPDNGIYNAMNKGIRMAEGEYCLFLNSGDYLKEATVLEQVFTNDYTEDVLCCSLYIDLGPDAYIWHSAQDVTLYSFVCGCMQHSGAGFIKRALFDQYGYYDESLKIVADWKFYLIALGLGDATYRSLPIVSAVYNMDGVSAKQKDLQNHEHEITLRALIRDRELRDYQEHARLVERLRIQADEIRSSWPYRIGAAVLRPIKWVIKK